MIHKKIKVEFRHGPNEEWEAAHDDLLLQTECRSRLHFEKLKLEDPPIGQEQKKNHSWKNCSELKEIFIDIFEEFLSASLIFLNHFHFLWVVY